MNRQEHDANRQDNEVAADAKGVLQSCSKAVCPLAAQREYSRARAVPPVIQGRIRQNNRCTRGLSVQFQRARWGLRH